MGHARVEWSYKKRVYHFDQAIVIFSPQKAVFETLDDFGNTLLRIYFEGNELMLVEMAGGSGLYKASRFKKLLKLPLTKSEFIHYLLYQIPPHVNDLVITRDSYGRISSIFKNSKKKKNRYTISFSDFKKKSTMVYPQFIEIQSKKTSLKILWKAVQLRP